MKRNHERVQFSDPPLTKAGLVIMNEQGFVESEVEVKLHDLSVTGLCFSSGLHFYEGQQLVLKLKLFAPTNQIFGEIVWKSEHDGEFTYGVSIITADLAYFQYMQSYDDYIQNKKRDILVGGRQ
ncbi:PilZ domain-containing protein [Aquibacillus koreensis]|uniref:PilZ domain-containing protein n=1 Tax=Aquibacillus koreensis TaxID=279446 RepID=A0A9X3WIX7_9BACI|nr:PilZ domain-containing protein [Aquibacillus koreensis]MCT2535279.1 PilZ domain-containing protein [Aquibacillus koreensis]MDC3419788.1 PilZ domain-containing protein [Aquibacillus koreensis]